MERATGSQSWKVKVSETEKIVEVDFSEEVSDIDVLKARAEQFARVGKSRDYKLVIGCPSITKGAEQSARTMSEEIKIPIRIKPLNIKRD
jgi:hypothetical protein